VQLAEVVCQKLFTPVITKLANLSLQTGRFPSHFKRAQVLPLLKKAGLDSSSPANYRPISNLVTISKILERLVLSRLRPHLLGSPNFSQYQSAYRTGHSTETAILEVLDGVYLAADEADLRAHRSRSIRRVRHRRPLDTDFKQTLKRCLGCIRPWHIVTNCFRAP